MSKTHIKHNTLCVKKQKKYSFPKRLQIKKLKNFK